MLDVKYIDILILLGSIRFVCIPSRVLETTDVNAEGILIANQNYKGENDDFKTKEGW